MTKSRVHAPAALVASWLLVLACGCGDDDDGGGNAISGDGGSAPCAEHGGDRDGDQVCDAEDNCPARANSTQTDSDGDGTGDACDETPERCDDHGGDADGDGVCEHADNCPGKANPDQRNGDGDGQGDACDESVEQGFAVCAGRGGDDDDDGVCQAGDNCPTAVNADQRDGDHDGHGDACDDTPEPCDAQGGDRDGDGICDRSDNCPELPNVTQLDRDFDQIGDGCDPSLPATSPDDPCAGIGGDDDSDAWCGMHDNCPTVANKDQKDGDEDGLGDACDEEACDGVDNDGDDAIDEGQADADQDGRADCVDPCPSLADGDEDGDGLADCGDPCPADPRNDGDKDLICDGRDNCPLRANNNQLDRDGDGTGDACDHEECDGLSNDQDNLIDEGLPDEDADKVCDAIDPCLGDRYNDLDGDGICFASDSCPDTPNAGDVDADHDQIGDVCDLDMSCLPAVPLLAAGAEKLPTLIDWADIAVSPNGATLYALTGATATPYASELLAVDMATRDIRWRMVLGGSPTALELSSDGTRAWVVITGARSVRMIDLVGRRRCGDFAVWSDARQLLQPTRLSAIPGRPGSVIVTAEATTRIVDEGRARPKALASVVTASANSITAIDDHTAYSSGGFSTGFQVHSFGPLGFESVVNAPGVLDEGIATVAGGRIYTTGGSIIDPAVPRRLADLPATGQVALDLGRQHIYYAVSPINSTGTVRGTVDVWNAQTFAYVGTIPRTVSSSASTFLTTRRVFRWGSAGLIVLFTGSSASLDQDVLWIVDDLDAALTRP